VHIVQILLPLTANRQPPQQQELFASVRELLTNRFGGLTAYTRSPAEGLWKDDGATERDDVVIFEVMVDELDREWWSGYRPELEALFEQELIVVRAHKIEML
jgi:hypothetical protein